MAIAKVALRLPRARVSPRLVTARPVALHQRRGYAQPRETSAERRQPAQHVRIVEVGARDGLQNEKKTIPLETKVELIRRLAKTGLKDIEAGSFVSPKWVPQMATSADVLSSLLKDTPTSPTPINYSFLAPNMKGLESAMSVINSAPATNATHPPIEFSVFAAATESFTRKNLNCTIAESLQRFEPVVTAAKDAGYRVRGYISVVLGCPFEGADVSPHKIAEVATALLEMGCDEISLGDTTGMGTAPRTAALLTSLAKAGLRPEDLAMHFHDTFGQALVNTAISLEHGIRTFDASVGGLGGCPYSPGATGNVATEDMVYFLESLGLDTGVDLDQLTDIGEWISGELGRKNASTVGRAVLGRRKLAS